MGSTGEVTRRKVVRQNRVVTITTRRIIITVDRIGTVLTEEETKIFKELIDKLKKGVR